MKWNYKNQLIVSVMVILFTNILSTILKHWVFRSIGFIICGLLWIIHPVLVEGAEVTQRTLMWVKAAGVILILIGVFTRASIH